MIFVLFIFFVFSRRKKTIESAGRCYCIPLRSDVWTKRTERQEDIVDSPTLQAQATENEQKNKERGILMS